jgi:hypothetical protein
MTKKTLKKIETANLNIYYNIRSLKEAYNNDTIDRSVILAEIRGYLMALQQTGFISEQEKRVLSCYITL